MKQLLTLFLGSLFFVSCQNNETSTAGVKPDSATYPYTIKEAESWEMNPDSKNMLIAMGAVKAFENRNKQLSTPAFSV
ncbi:MAG: hypothetical protein EOO07_00160 [Chitinophagaceae bacterium]|nr:MAG: hypothetical protein EOO07_00160 [Chitinophagaceae bacterium]